MDSMKRNWLAILLTVSGLGLLVGANVAVERAAAIAPVPLDQLGLAMDHSEQAAPIVAASAPFQIVGADPAVDNTKKNVRLWDFVLQVRGSHLPNYPQLIGDCVSFGAKNALEYLQCCQIARPPPGEPTDEFHPIDPSFIYGISRHQIGSDKIRGDGSVGAWAAEGTTSYGVLAADHPQCPPYSAARAKEWGRTGPPQWALDAAKERLVKSTALIKSAADGCDAITNGYPFTIASNFGTTTIRPKDGRQVALWNSTWYHQMCVVGYDGSAASGERYFYVLNSWGPSSHPMSLQSEPPGGFWVTWKDMDRIVKQNDSWAFSSFDGFPSREIDFSVFGAARDAVPGDTKVVQQEGAMIMLPAEAFGPMVVLGSMLVLAGLVLALWGNVRRRGMAGAAMLAVVCLSGGPGEAQDAKGPGVWVASQPKSQLKEKTFADGPISFQAWGLADTSLSLGTTRTTSPASRTSPTSDSGKLCLKAWGVDGTDAGSVSHDQPPISFACFGADDDVAATETRTIRVSSVDRMDKAVPSGSPSTAQAQALVFWRDGCSDCLKEKSWLLTVIKPLGWNVSDSPDADFRLVDTRKDTVLRERYRIDVVPQTVYVDATGKEVSRIVGFDGPMNVTDTLLKIRGQGSGLRDQVSVGK
jgi:hypothetical protein